MKIAFGPVAERFPSWQWVGQDIVDELHRSSNHEVLTFADDVPACDVVVFVKFKPSLQVLQDLRKWSRLLYCPIDIYGSCAQIDADWESLWCFDCIVSHSRHLMKYFRSYARTEYLDHHIKFAAPLPTERKTEGPILWTGNAANLQPLIAWVEQNPLPEELWVLTNMDSDAFRACRIASARIRVDQWTPDRHRDWAGTARAAIDIKGDDFRSRHKPPTKAFDFVASGLPLALNHDCPSALDLAGLGLKVPTPNELGRWFSDEYWQQTQDLGRGMRQELNCKGVALKLMSIIRSLLR